MKSAARTFTIIGALSAALAVGMGAFGAHALRESLTARRLEIYQTAVLYHLVHSLGLLAVAFVCSFMQLMMAGNKQFRTGFSMACNYRSNFRQFNG